MTPELLKYLIGALASCTVVIVGAVVWLTVLTFRIGHKYGAVETKLERLDKVTSKLEEITEELTRLDVLETKLASLMDSHSEERRRFASDWPVLKSRVDTLWEKVMSIADWRKSQPKFGSR